MPVGIGEDYAEGARTLANARRDLALLHRQGLRVLRLSLPWEAMEPEPGRYDWKFWDEYISLATDQYHIRLLPYLCYTPRWAATVRNADFWREPPRDDAQFAEFVKRVVTRYRGRIHSWEIWNEPDNSYYWLGSVEQFAALLRAGSVAVREADPSAQVVMGGLAWNLSFLEAMLTNGPTMRAVNIVNLHNYYETWAEDPLERIPAYIGRAGDLLNRYHDPLPIWTAEVGYSSFRQGAQVSGQFRAYYTYEHTPAGQAAALFRALTLLQASGRVSLVTWYRLHDLPATQEVIGDVNNRFLGLVDTAGHPKPALRALRYFRALFHNGYQCLDTQARVTKRLKSAAEVHAFARPDGSVVVVAWLRTVVPGERGDNSGQVRDRRREKVVVALPFALKPDAALFNELGEATGLVPVARQRGRAHFHLALQDGKVRVVILRRAGRNHRPGAARTTTRAAAHRAGS